MQNKENVTIDKIIDKEITTLLDAKNSVILYCKNNLVLTCPISIAVYKNAYNKSIKMIVFVKINFSFDICFTSSFFTSYIKKDRIKLLIQNKIHIIIGKYGFILYKNPDINEIIIVTKE